MKVNRVTKKDGKIVKSQVDVPEPQYNVRINPSIYEQFVRIAALEQRSVTRQINYALEQALSTKLK